MAKMGAMVVKQFSWTGFPETSVSKYEGWNFNCGNYLFTTDTK